MLRSSAGALCASSLSALLLVLLAGLPARASASAASGSPAPELFVHPSPFPPAYTAASDQPIVLTAPQTNALLAHHLGVEHHVNWPLPATTTTSSAAAGSRDWELALEQPTLRNAGESDSITTRRRVVVVLECGKPGCTEAIPLHLRPEANSGQRPLVLPALPPTSYLAAVSLHLHRLVDAVPGLEPEHVQGLERLVQSGIKAVRGWQGWVSEELGNWIGWHDGEVQVEPQVEPEWPGKAGLVSELDLLDGSAKQLVLDLQQLAAVADHQTQHHRLHDASPLTVIHLTGLKDVAAQHARSSATYQRAAALLQQSLTAALAALDSSTGSSYSLKTILLALPAPKTPLLRRRKPWLEPFEQGLGGKQTRGVGVIRRREGATGARAGAGGLERRSVFAPRQAESTPKENKNGTYLVPSSYTCFPSRSALENATASCLEHGEPVPGLTTRTDLQEGEECWVCRCGVTRDEESGKRTRWTGEGCEKVDLSADFALLSLTTLGLVLTVVISIGLLYRIGSQELPGTLSSVGGDGGRMKRD